MKETFKNIRGYEALFSVSNFGNVRNNATGRLLKQTKRKSGYLVVTLKGTQLYVHRLVLQTFKPCDDPTKVCDHRDSKRDNNLLQNLQWLSISDNVKKAAKDGRHLKGSSQPNAKLTESDVLIIRKSREENSGLSVLAKRFDVSTVTIWRVVKRKNWNHI